MILNKILSLAASIIKLLIFITLTSNSNSEENNFKYYSPDKGIVSLMYHRFNENKYPSTNITMDVFERQMVLIGKNNFKFYNPKELTSNFDKPKSEKKILITIDDAFSSFYENAWPYLKKNKIPFILFVSTEPVGKKGYMSWKEINEIQKEDFAFIGNHSHSHDYLINYNLEKFKEDIDLSIKIFQEKLGYNPIYFSYPFGEYSLAQKIYIKEKFKYAFGQHSGVIDFNKDKFELPRFPINEKYGDLNRFEFLINLLPLQFKSLKPENKYLVKNNNPPSMIVEFFKDQKNLDNISCFSDETGNWNKTNIILKNKKLFVNFKEKFSFRRGRINCSLNDTEGWRWFGIQFSIQEN